jgi:precorrin-2 dehydrogenase/sirohydrochlorin ferrochelatase
MIGVCEKYTLDELVQLDDDDMDRLLVHYMDGSVPAYEEIRPHEPTYDFDGSFGWHC